MTYIGFIKTLYKQKNSFKLFDYLNNTKQLLKSKRFIIQTIMFQFTFQVKSLYIFILID